MTNKRKDTMKTRTQQTAARILEVNDLGSTGLDRHVSGAANFTNGKRYRFYSHDGVVQWIAELDSFDNYRREWRKKLPSLIAMQIGEAIRPHIDRVVAEAIQRRADEDRKAREEREASIRRQTLQDAAPELLEALKNLVETPEVRQEDMQQARAAIAKAEGTQ